MCAFLAVYKIRVVLVKSTLKTPCSLSFLALKYSNVICPFFLFNKKNLLNSLKDTMKTELGQRENK